MKTDELREKYLAFFETKGHTRKPSDVLVPTWDPSVLFTPAGMNQFKDHFLGKVKLDFTRATTCQKCMRTGDIDQVGRTARHHTFFEMLGNFSFGDYFKREAIIWAWEFLIDKKWLGINPDRLSVTVYKDDDEAAEIWAGDVGLPRSRIVRMDEDENFWPASAPSQGPDGVCGPCSEIYYHAERGNEGVEIWNLVFTQFNRIGDPPANLHPLPSKNIDTGMGLERAAAALQGVETNYHIDILLPIVEAAAEVTGIQYEYESDDGRRLRRITDHIRACTFAIHENVYPGANKEKYVVKRLLRRAVLDGHQMGRREPFLYRLVPAVVDVMKTAYPELAETVDRVSGVIQKEEDNFFGTIDGGLERIERVFDTMRTEHKTSVDGAVAADLYQTYGVPPELFESLAAEHKLAFDWDGYHQAMAEHGEASGKVQHMVMGSKGPIDSLKEALHQSEFLGYESTVADATVKGIVIGAGKTERLANELTAADQEARVVLDQTPFYGESGGQVGDQGTLSTDDSEFQVTDTQRDGALIIHIGRLTKGTLKTGAKVTARVDDQRRDAIRRAHSATHILHHALQKHLGSHAQQQGSKVDDDWLRFDFTNLQPVERQQLQSIELDVTKHVAAAEPIRWETLPLAEARAAGAMMLFGEKYPDPVRMVSMGDFSKELCGGTHLSNTGDVQSFEIIGEEGVSAGTRRIFALTGAKASANAQRTREVLTAAAEQLDVSPLVVPTAVKQLAEQVRGLKKQLSTGVANKAAQSSKAAATTNDAASYPEIKSALRDTARVLNVPVFEVAERVRGLMREIATLTAEVEQMAQGGDISADSLLEKSETIAGTTVVVSDLAGGNSNLMRQLIDQIRKKSAPCAVLLAASQGDNKVTLVAGVSRDLVEKGINAGQWVRDVAPVVGGGGGGKPDMAQAGGKIPAKVPDALAKAREVIESQLAG